MPIRSQWTVKTVDVSHPVPRKICRSCEETPYLFIGQTEFLPDTHGNGFTCDTCQRHVHTVQGHPVYLFGPSLPVPVRGCVSESADIQKISQGIRGLGRLPVFRPVPGNVDMLSAPCHHRAASITEIPVECIAQGHRAAAPEDKVSSLSHYFIAVFAGPGGRNNLQHDVIGIVHD